MLKYDKLLKELEAQGWTTYRIRKENLIGQATLFKLRAGGGMVDAVTLDRLCRVLNKQPGDLVEYVPDPE